MVGVNFSWGKILVTTKKHWSLFTDIFFEISVFETLCNIRYTTKFSRSGHSSSKKITVIIFTLLLLFMSGDTESKTGPNKTNSSCKSSVCHWNLNSLVAYNFEKIGQLEAYNTINKFDTKYVSQSYLNSKCSSDCEDIII